jgi:hypothetical protein
LGRRQRGRHNPAFPAVLAECDAVFGPTLNPRIARCGPTRL